MDSVTNQTPSSSTAPSTSQASSSSSCTKYDVFLNFRGTDTRYRFISHLYPALLSYGIITYKDTPELPPGDEVNKALMEAIQKSKIYIVVLSENYSSSHSCLDELVEILYYHTQEERLVIPVFCHINPWVLRYPVGKFKDHFDTHERRAAESQEAAEKKLKAAAEIENDWPERAAAERKAAAAEMEKALAAKERISTWRTKLAEVTKISGMHISDSEGRSEADITKNIVGLVLSKINRQALYIAEHPVGLESRVKEITALIENKGESTEGVIKIGMYGMGGIGKTTLAKALFNQLLRERRFDSSCCLENVREVWKNTNGPESLQKKLLKGLYNRKPPIAEDRRPMFIKENLQFLKVLLLIDDLDDRDQYNSLVGELGPGSVVILTTELVEILDDIKVEVKLLNKAESKELFNLHAFRSAEPDQTLLEMSKRLLHHAAGLPLAHMVFGSFCRSESVERLGYFIRDLDLNPHAKFKEKFSISLKALKDLRLQLHDIFLDIACFFNKKKRTTAVKILKTYYKEGINESIKILEERCLLTINTGEELMIHSVLQDVGRDVARNDSHGEPGKYSRLWESEHIHDVLRYRKGTDTIKGIVDQDFENQDALRNESFVAEAFKMMSYLRFLHLPGVRLTGSYELMFNDLTWLRWDCCPLDSLPSQFYPEKLVILELPRGKMKQMWKESNVTIYMKMSNLMPTCIFSKQSETQHMSSKIQGFFTQLPLLETLNLEECKSLEEVHGSIGSSTKLVELNLRGCSKLSRLPDTICNLELLEVLNICKCSGLVHLPKLLGNMRSLKELKASGASLLKKVPDLSKLEHLKKLDLTDCSGLTAIQGLEKLTSLRELHLGGCRTSVLKDTLTERFFQNICSASRAEIQITTTELPGWINSESIVTAKPEMRHNFLGMILCIKDHKFQKTIHRMVLWVESMVPYPGNVLIRTAHNILRSRVTYSVKNMTTGLVWSGSASTNIEGKSLMVVVPKSIFPVTDGADRIEFRTDIDVRTRGIHLLYRTESQSLRSVI